MSPEQVRGEAVDHRSDLFALGAVLYEMLTGQRAFRRDTAAETMAAILKEEPPGLLTVNQNLPPVLEPIVEHCLAKDPTARVQSARDLAFELELALGLSGTTSAPRSLRLEQSSVGAPAHLGPRRPDRGRHRGRCRFLVPEQRGAGNARPLRLNISLPPKDRLPVGNRPVFALSPDGERVVFTVVSGDAPRLYIRELSEPEAKPLPGVDSGVNPFFSPDGRWVGYLGLLRREHQGDAARRRRHSRAEQRPRPLRGELGRRRLARLCLQLQHGSYARGQGGRAAGGPHGARCRSGRRLPRLAPGPPRLEGRALHRRTVGQEL